MNLIEFGLSSISGILSTGTTILISHESEHLVDPVKANIIGLISGAALNFLLQKLSFQFKKKPSAWLVYKYLIAEIIILSLSQLLFTIYHKNKHWYKKEVLEKIKRFLPEKFNSDKYDNSIARVIIASLVFITVSFPLRKLWIFKKA